MDERVRVTVVVPTYNRARTLEACLQALSIQTLDRNEYEVLVVDDGSRDGTLQVCESAKRKIARLRVHQQPNRGPAAARNAGWQRAEAGIVAFTDDDCAPPREWLAQILAPFDADPALAGVGGVMITPVGDWVPLSHHSDLTSPGAADYSRFIGTNNAAYRRNVLEAVGGFDERFRHVSVEDAELYIRVSRIGRTLIDPSLYVVHPARRMRFAEALKGYVRFYNGYVALKKIYPDEFARIYGASPERAVLKGRSWRRRAALYLPGMVSHPWLAVQFLAYLGLSRTAVMALALANKVRTAS